MNIIRNWCFYLLGLILFSGCGQDQPSPRILLIHSFHWNDKTYPELNASIQSELKKKGIYADVKTFYLNCDAYQAREEEQRMFRYIDQVRNWKPDLILVNDDQAAYTLMKCRHPLIKTVPVVFSGVSFPNWELLKEFPNITGSWDKSDYQANLRFIEKEFGKMRVYINYDQTVLGKLAFQSFLDQVNWTDYMLNLNAIAKYTENKSFGFDKAQDSIETATIGLRPEKLTINFMPFREAQGQILLAQVSGAFPYSAFLNIRHDHTSSGLAKIFDTPSFTTTREIFGVDMEVLGGYFCSNNMQAQAQVDIASKILKGVRPSDIPITESPKEYLYDWEEMKRLDMSLDDVPTYIRIANLPFYVRYQAGLTALGMVVGCLLFCLIGYLLYLYTREIKRKKKVLENLRQEKLLLSVALERAEESDRMKSAFLANMSHEIRTPLNAIVGFSNLMNSGEDLVAEEKEQFVKLINTNSDLLLKLINDILDLSRIESGKMDFVWDYFNLNNLISDVYHTHQLLVPSAVELRMSVPETPVTVLVDQYRLRQVLTNFINNAVKFTPSGYIEIGYNKDESDGSLSVYVEDTGSGIPEEKQYAIFERFHKLDEFAQGTGLGLAICQVIATRFGGKIQLKSEVGKGSRFMLIIPKERIS